MENNLKRFAATKLDYEFADITLLEKAFRHKSLGSDNNERLEFLGDSALNFVIAEALFSKFGDVAEGNLTRIRAHLVCKDTLINVAEDLVLNDLIQVSDNEFRTGGHQRMSILGDAVEGILGAIVVDSDIFKCKKVILKLFKKYIDQVSLDKLYKDAKTTLQELLQSEGVDLPVYEVVETSGPPHAQMFKVSCTVSAKELITFAEGASRRKAEQEAAQKLLDLLNG